MARRKFYVVWEGQNPGIYDTWEECEAQVKNFPGARYKAYDDQTAATLAFRGNDRDTVDMLRTIASHKAKVINYEAFPDIILDSIAVDGACAKNPGPMEYQGVRVRTGERVFHVGPLDDGTNNVGEYLALIHALAMLDKEGDTKTAIYSDSRTAISWIRKGGHRSTLARTTKNGKIFDLLDRADKWLIAHYPVKNPIYKWDTDQWGEIPADFGRK